MRKRTVGHFLTKPQGRIEHTTTNMTFSMTRDTAARLKELAEARGSTFQDLIAQAVDEWIERQA